jgi:crotonobetainyl-CoA:carnitine CoA-transferase CaiB-like acyl-CoA transferase
MQTKPLSGVTVIEFEGIGPCPLAGMMLADMGAEVIVIGRKTSNQNGVKITPKNTAEGFLHRGKRLIQLDLKQAQGIELAMQLIAKSEVLIEGFRPGVMDKLGLGPEIFTTINPKLVYGRLTGWGQTGPLAQAAGHDPNFVALAGAMHAGAGADQKPTAPLTLVGDVGGGTMMLLWGVMCALWQAQSTGKGQVVDAAITDGCAYGSSLLWMITNASQSNSEVGGSWTKGAAPWNDTYRCSDGHFINVCALEPKFFSLLLELLELNKEACFKDQWQQQAWPQGQLVLTQKFASQTRQYWCDLLEGSDACFAPVLSFAEATQHPHHKARNTFVELDGVTQPAPAPRMAHNPFPLGSVPTAGQDTVNVLAQLGVLPERIAQLQKLGVV